MILCMCACNYQTNGDYHAPMIIAPVHVLTVAAYSYYLDHTVLFFFPPNYPSIKVLYNSVLILSEETLKTVFSDPVLIGDPYSMFKGR